MKNLKKCSMEELQTNLRIISEEIEKRRNMAKEQAWQEVVCAIKKYTADFGKIEVSRPGASWFYIQGSENFDFIGEISAYKD